MFLFAFEVLMFAVFVVAAKLFWPFPGFSFVKKSFYLFLTETYIIIQESLSMYALKV
jgi:hypothetical protein